MLPEEVDIQLLKTLGFSSTQARIYLNLLKLGPASGNYISKKTRMSRTIVYRTLKKLQGNGFVEKTIDRPCKYIATPIEDSLKILLDSRLLECGLIKSKSEELIQRLKNYSKTNKFERDYEFRIIEGREKILQILKESHKNASYFIYGISTLGRWLKILEYCREEITDLIERKVPYKMIIQLPDFETRLPENLKCQLLSDNFEIRATYKFLESNIGVIDESMGFLNLYPAKSLSEAPLFYTNHPSLLTMYGDHFRKIWQSPELYKLKPSMFR